MASYTEQAQHLTNQTRQHQTGLSNQISVLAQAKPAIVSPSTATTASNNSFSIPTGALSEKINSALNLSSTSLSQQERTDISKLFSNYDNAANKHQQNMQRTTKQQHIEDDNVLMKQNATNQMRQAAVMAAVASQQKIRLSATERLAMTAKKPVATTGPQSSVQSRQTTTENSNVSSTPLTGSKSTSSLPTLETLLAVQRQLQQHTRQNLNSSVPQQQMVIPNSNNPDKAQQQDPAPKQQNTRTILSQQNSNDSNTQYQPHASCKKPLPPSPPKSPSIQQIDDGAQIVQRCPVVMTYEKELPPLPRSVSPSTTCTTTDESQMNSLESHQSSPATSLVSIPPPPPPISSYLEQYDEVNSACRQSNSSTPSTIATSDISSVRHFSFVQNNTTQNENIHYQQQQQDCKPKPPTLAPKPTRTEYERVLQSQTNHLNEKIQHSTGTFNNWSNNYTQTLKQQSQIASMKRDFNQLQNSYTQSVQANKALVTDSDSNESSSASNNSYDISYKPQLNYQQHVFTRTAASLPSMALPAPPPPPPSFSSNQQQVTALPHEAADGFDEVDSAFRFPTPPPLDMLLDQVNEDDDVKKPVIQSDDEDFQCRIPTPPHQKSMSSVSFQDMNNQQQQQQQQNHLRIHRKQSLSPPTFGTSSPPSATQVQPPALFRQSQPHLQIPPPPPPVITSNQQQASRKISPPLSTSTDPISAPQLTVHINNNESGLLSTAPSNANNLHSHHHHHSHHLQSSVNHHYNHHHHMAMLTSLAASSSSPSSSSDGDGQSSNSSSSTSGIHSSIDSPSSSNSKLDDFNYSASKLREKAALVRQPCLPNDNLTNNNLKNISTKLTSTTSKLHHSVGATGVTGAPFTGATAAAAVAAKQTTTTTTTQATIIKPALKQKKSVSFSDKVELVACAEEQCEDHLPNPLLARVLAAGKLQ